MHALLLTGLLQLVSSNAYAASPAVPTRQIPPEVLVELQLLENRFELALAADCDPALCYSKGCVWLDHAVADQPRSSSMPGLAQEPGPSAVDAQQYLTRAQCSFANEPTLESANAQALVRRLQTRLTRGWTVVTVDHEVLPPLLPVTPVEAEPAAPPVPEPAPPPAPEEWTAAAAGHELWDTLLPHFFWMIGLGLATTAAATLIWAWRRVGRASVEEQALLAQLSMPEPAPSADAGTGAEDAAGDADRAFVAEQEASWKTTLESMDPDHPDPELQALVRERLRAGDLPLLAKAVLRFPEHFPAIFPNDGETATAKLELAELLQTVDAAALPGDLEFFTALQRHALAATLSSQPDARIVRSLREDFGAGGLVELIGQLPARIGALLFALSPPVEQHEMVRLLSVTQIAGLCQQLLRSNRMDPSETRALFEILRGAHGEGGLPIGLPTGEITDRGVTFDAAGALAVLLPSLPPRDRAAVFDDALRRTHGSLPAWTRGIVTADMLFTLSPESRADMLLELELEPLAAWLSLVDTDSRARLLDGLPASLRASIQAASVFPSRTRQLSLAGRTRREMARGFQHQLARARIPFEHAVRPADEPHP
jgi:hypothetical protein